MLKHQLPIFVVVLCLAAVLSACVEVGEVHEIEHEFGAYLLYVPHSHTPDSKVVVVVHGTPGIDQDVVALARRFMNRWISFAETTGAVIVAPAFDQVDYASCDGIFCGGFGGYRGLYGRVVGADEFLHGILDQVGVITPVQTAGRRFFLYGHSAGGQFAARYVVRHPERVLGVVLSAPGRYAFPDPTARWHYGMRSISREINWVLADETQEIDITPDPDGWVEAATLPITVVIGDEDTADQPCRPAHCSDGESEFTTRIAIGKKWMEDMNNLADSNDLLGRVRMEIVPGVGHDSAGLTDDSQEVLRNLLEGRVIVPDVVGMTERQAMNVLQLASLQGRIGERMLSDRPRGEVILQLPGADSWANRGSHVVLNVSLGVEQPPPATVPDIVGETLLVAAPAIRAAGFMPMPVFVESDRPFEEVIDQMPAGGERAAPGSEVRLFVSRGRDDLP